MGWEDVLAGISGGLSGGLNYYLQDLARQDRLKKEEEDRAIAMAGVTSKLDIQELKNQSALEIQNLKTQSLFEKAMIEERWRRYLGELGLQGTKYAADKRLQGVETTVSGWKDRTGALVAGEIEKQKLVNQGLLERTRLQNTGDVEVANIMADSRIKVLERKYELDPSGAPVEIIRVEKTDEEGNKLTNEIRRKAPLPGGYGWGDTTGSLSGTPWGEGWSSEVGDMFPQGQNYLPQVPGSRWGDEFQYGGPPQYGRPTPFTMPGGAGGGGAQPAVPVQPPTAPAGPAPTTPMPTAPTAKGGTNEAKVQAARRIEGLVNQVRNEQNPQRRARLRAELDKAVREFRATYGNE